MAKCKVLNLANKAPFTQVRLANMYKFRVTT